MLEELHRYENLGTPGYYCELLTLLTQDGRVWTVKNIEEYFYNRVIDGKSIFDGCLPMAQHIGMIRVNSKGIIQPSPQVIQALSSEKRLNGHIITLFLTALKRGDDFDRIFLSENLSYDVIYRLIQIEWGAFYPKYANICNFLIDFGFIYKHPDLRIRRLIIKATYRYLFDKELLPYIRKRKLGIEKLKALLDRDQIIGREAELFVLQFEKTRLGSHKKVQDIVRISDYDVGAGYDIVSFDKLDSSDPDRFIEVKSFSHSLRFHWSRNEIEVSRVFRDKYFIYLVDRNSMTKDGYIPLIIQNPYMKIMESSDKWSKTVDSYYVSVIEGGS